MGSGPFKVQQPWLVSSSEVDILCITSTEHSPVMKATVMATSFPVRASET